METKPRTDRTLENRVGLNSRHSLTDSRSCATVDWALYEPSIDINMASSSSQSYRKFQKLERTVAKARHLGFDYDWDNGLLMFGDYWCMEVERLREILSPDHPGYDDVWDQRDFEADKACLRDKEWFVAQSQYYGLRLGDVKMKTLRNLRRDLAELVKMGAVRRSNPSATENRYLT